MQTRGVKAGGVVKIMKQWKMQSYLEGSDFSFRKLHFSG